MIIEIYLYDYDIDNSSQMDVDRVDQTVFPKKIFGGIRLYFSKYVKEPFVQVMRNFQPATTLQA